MKVVFSGNSFLYMHKEQARLEAAVLCHHFYLLSLDKKDMRSGGTSETRD